MPTVLCSVLAVLELAASVYMFSRATSAMHDIASAVLFVGACLTAVGACVIEEMRYQMDRADMKIGNAPRWPRLR